jgi:hypothetical protein
MTVHSGARPAELAAVDWLTMIPLKSVQIAAYEATRRRVPGA